MGGIGTEVRVGALALSGLMSSYGDRPAASAWGHQGVTSGDALARSGAERAIGGRHRSDAFACSVGRDCLPSLPTNGSDLLHALQTSYRKSTPMKNFLNDEAGLETVEYAIIAGMIVAGTVAVVVAIGGWVNGQFTALQTDLGA